MQVDSKKVSKRWHKEFYSKGRKPIAPLELIYHQNIGMAHISRNFEMNERNYYDIVGKIVEEIFYGEYLIPLQ